MIRQKYNLKCAAGHYHYSPTPNAFVDLGCGKPFVSPMTASGDLRRDAERCSEKLKKLR
jgi:hypothetical protein